MFFFNATATTEIYTLSLHDALPISADSSPKIPMIRCTKKRSRRCAKSSHTVSATARIFVTRPARKRPSRWSARFARSEEHTSELQSHSDLVCRLLLEKKKKIIEKYV